MNPLSQLPSYLVASSSNSKTVKDRQIMLSTCSQWCSSRRCNYPQWLMYYIGGLDHDTEEDINGSVQSIQIIVHNYKIASKISLAISKTSKPFEINEIEIAWTDIGHIIPSTNKACRFRTTELITIPITNTPFQFNLVKLQLSVPYANELNMYDQVSLLNVRFLGHASLRASVNDLPDRSPYPDVVTKAYEALQALLTKQQDAITCKAYELANALKFESDSIMDLIRQFDQCHAMVFNTDGSDDAWNMRLVDIESRLNQLINGLKKMEDRTNVDVAFAASGPMHVSDLSRKTQLLGFNTGLPYLPTNADDTTVSTTQQESSTPKNIISPPLNLTSTNSPAKTKIAKSPISPTPLPTTPVRQFESDKDTDSLKSPKSPSKWSSLRLFGSKATSDPIHTPQPQSNRLDSKSSILPPNPKPVLVTSSSPRYILSDIQLVDYRLAVDWLDVELVAKFLSKDFHIRTIAIDNILKLLKSYNESKQDLVVVVKGSFVLIESAMSDLRERVILWGIRIWNALASVVERSKSSLGGPLYLSLCSGQWQALLNCSADTNNRISNPARDLLVKHVCTWPSTFCSLLIKEVSYAKTGVWRLLWMKVEIVNETMGLVGIHSDQLTDNSSTVEVNVQFPHTMKHGGTGLKRNPSESKNLPRTAVDTPHTSVGYDLVSIQALLTQALTHSHGEVRNAAGTLLVHVAKLVGPEPVLPILESLNQRSQVNTLMAKLIQLYPHIKDPTLSPPLLTRKLTDSNMNESRMKSNSSGTNIPQRHFSASSSRLAAKVPNIGMNKSMAIDAKPVKRHSITGLTSSRKQPKSKHIPKTQAEIMDLPAYDGSLRRSTNTTIASIGNTSNGDENRSSRFWDRIFHATRSKPNRNMHSSADERNVVEEKSNKGGFMSMFVPQKEKSVNRPHRNDDPMGLLGTSILSTSEPRKAMDETDWNLDFTCVFCEEVNPEFVGHRLDEHYWRECPMLCTCAYCSEVVEVAVMQMHLQTECKASTAKSVHLHENACVLCGLKVHQPSEVGFREHLLTMPGCPKALRLPKPGVKYRI